MRWLPLIERWHADFVELDPAWVLAVVAQESQGFPYLEGSDGAGSVGLMQVIPRSWTGTKQQLENPAFNLYVGMRMLSGMLDQTRGNLRRPLAAYNCGFESLDAGRCSPQGGYAYARRVLDYWTPIFRPELFRWANTEWNSGGRQRTVAWLATLGYDRGLGDWQEEEDRIEQFRHQLHWSIRVRVE